MSFPKPHRVWTSKFEAQISLTLNSFPLGYKSSRDSFMFT